MKLPSIRRSEALARDKARAKRSDEEQLKLIATRRGDSKREKARLMSRIAATAKPADVKQEKAAKPVKAKAEKGSKPKAEKTMKSTAVKTKKATA
jgi:hypothetical protein